MKKIAFVSILAMLFTSCKKENTYCGVSDPINDIAWLKQYISEAEHCRIYKGSFKSIDGFFTELCSDSTCQHIVGAFRDCSDSVHCAYGGALIYTCADSNATNRILLFEK